jgi:K+-dependent Na+/Ca+ exchanger-like protein
MAAGSSAPELFTSVADTFATSNNIGIGTIVGSAMFNILVIVAVSQLYAGSALLIDWRCVARDVAYYSTSVGMLVVFFLTGDIIEWWEGFVMVLTYGSYILFMVHNERILNSCTCGMHEEAIKAAAPSRRPSVVKVSEPEMDALKQKREDELKKQQPQQVSMAPMDMNNAQNTAAAAVAEDTKVQEEEEEGAESLWEIPDSLLGKLVFALSIPFYIVFTITIPDCNKVQYEKLYPLTFVMCIIWLGVLCIVMALLGSAMGCIFGISPLVMGIVVLAVGTSVPDAMASMIVAKMGQGDMAIANAIGSNVFDILLGLGIPWMLYGLTSVCGERKFCPDLEYSGLIDADGKAVPLWDGRVSDCDNGYCVIFRSADGNLFVDLGILYSVVGLFLMTLKVGNWYMTNVGSYFLIFIYITYVVYQLSSQAE